MTNETADQRDTDATRHVGVEFGSLDDALESHTYPATVAELVDAYGDRELDLPGGTQGFEEVLRTSETDAYGSAREVREEVLTFVDERAIGRKHYSDRTPPVLGSEEEVSETL